MKTIKQREKEIEEYRRTHKEDTYLEEQEKLVKLKATLTQTKEIIKLIDEALTNARKKANSQIKDEQSMAHTHTAINQIDNELSKKIKGEDFKNGPS